MKRYFGNSLGVVLGPYQDGEIGPQLRAQRLLRIGPKVDVYAIRAHHLADARAALKSTLAKENKS